MKLIKIKTLTMIRFRERGERKGWLWHIAYYDPYSERIAYAPIPINFLIKAYRWFYAHIKPGWLDRIVSDAYQRGKADGYRSGQHTANRMWQDGLDKILITLRAVKEKK